MCTATHLGVRVLGEHVQERGLPALSVSDHHDLTAVFFALHTRVHHCRPQSSTDSGSSTVLSSAPVRSRSVHLLAFSQSDALARKATASAPGAPLLAPPPLPPVLVNLCAVASSQLSAAAYPSKSNFSIGYLKNARRDIQGLSVKANSMPY